jgi:hypothetical protein
MNIFSLNNKLVKRSIMLCLVVCLLGTQIMLTKHVMEHISSKGAGHCELCFSATQLNNVVVSNAFSLPPFFSDRPVFYDRSPSQQSAVIFEAYIARAPPAFLPINII